MLKLVNKGEMHGAMATIRPLRLVGNQGLCSQALRPCFLVPQVTVSLFTHLQFTTIWFE